MWRFNVIKEWDCIWSEKHLNMWNELLMQSPTSHVFFHPTIAKIWIDTYRPLRKIYPLFVWGEATNGNKVFFPLVLWHRNWKGAFIKSIIPVGYSDYDYHDPLFLTALSCNELSVFWKELNTMLSNYLADEILLCGLRDRCIAPSIEWKQGEICPSLNLTKIDSEEALMLFFGTKLRGDIRRQIRRLREMGELCFVEYTSVEDIPNGLFKHFLDSHSKKWPNAYKAPHFHDSLVAACGDNSPIHFSAMMLNNTPIAWHLGFEFQGVYYYYMPAGNPEYQKQSPVKIHLYYLIRRAIDKGYILYDHLRGDEAYKSGWSDSFQYVNNQQIISKTLSSKIKHKLVELKDFVR